MELLNYTISMLVVPRNPDVIDVLLFREVSNSFNDERAIVSDVLYSTSQQQLMSLYIYLAIALVFSLVSM